MKRFRTPGLLVAVLVLAACSTSTPFAVPSNGAAQHTSSVAARTGSRESVIYSFAGNPDGAGPIAGLIADKAGALYGTTIRGGGGCNPYGCGVVFKLTPSGSRFVESVLYAFGGGQDGSQPFGTLIMDATGALYGTTRTGGGDSSCSISGIIGCGTVFRLYPHGGQYAEEVLHRFHGDDGAAPTAGLVADKSGAFYGTTSQGGSHGYGAVFELTQVSKRYREKTVYSFGGYGTPDGNYPNAPLLVGAHGSLYGTTEYGGGTSLGFGTVFELKPRGHQYEEIILHRFQAGGGDGTYPLAGLVAGASGRLYGTTQHGGGGSSICFGGCGTVFQLTPNGSGSTELVLYGFKDGVDGALPQAGVILVHGTTLYGTTNYGGSGRDGTVYRLSRSGSGYSESILYAFPDGSEAGAIPYASLLDRSGTFYGTTYDGGSTGHGTVFEIR